MKLYFYKLLYFIFLFLSVLQVTAQSDTRRKDAWITDGEIERVQYTNGYTMLSGDFSNAGPYTGSGAIISTSTGIAYSEMPVVNGHINASVPDGSGGWYIGGYFQLVDTVKISNLAHIKADKTVDRAWKPNPGGEVYAMILNENVLYLGGYFQSVQGQTRNYLAALSVTDGKLTNWAPDCDGVVNALAVDGSTVYVGGYFTKVGGTTRNRIAAINADTGVLTTWNPNIGGINASVHAIIATPTVVYACGFFTAVGATTRQSIAAMNVTTGAATTWNPPVNVIGTLNTMLLSGTTLYVGGSLTVKGSSALNLVAINTTDATPVADFIPQVDNAPSSLAISGGTLYLGGTFSQVNGELRNYFAAVKASDGALLPLTCSPTGYVATVSTDGDNVFIGGQFNGINWEEHNQFMLLDETTDKPWPFTFEVDGNVNTVAIKDNILYIGGDFTTVNKKERYSLAAFEFSTGKLLPWAPIVYNYYSGAGVVNDMIIKDNTLYFGGSFGSIDKTVRINLAAVDLATGATTAFNISAGTGYYESVFELDLVGNTLYVAGNFYNTLPDKTQRTNLAAIDLNTNTILPWAPVCNATIYHIKVAPNAAYVVGNFYGDIGGATRNHDIAALDLTTGKATDWDPDFNNGTYDIALTSTDVYVSGYYTAIDTAKLYGGLASFSLTTGKLNAWRPDVRGNSDGTPGIISLAASKTRLHAGGYFEYVGGYADEQVTNYVEYALCSDAFDLTLKNSTLTSPAADSYQWYVNNKPIEGATKQTLEINIAEYGAYFVMLNHNDCSGRSKDYINLITGKEVTNANSLIRVFPNPSKEEFFIEVPEQSTLTMLNMMGQPVRTSQLETEQTNRIETRGLTTGTYILVVRSSSKTNYLKIIKSY